MALGVDAMDGATFLNSPELFKWGMYFKGGLISLSSIPRIELISNSFDNL
jgi:hypothetical protein